LASFSLTRLHHRVEPSTDQHPASAPL